MITSSERHPGRRSAWQLAWQLTRQTIDGFSRDRGDLVASALAFYALLSLAPLILIAMAIAALVLGMGTMQQELHQVLREGMGTVAADAVTSWVQGAASGGAVASTIGLVFSLIAASRLATHLHSALNQIWNVEPPSSDGAMPAVKEFFRNRAFALLLVVASGPVLLLVVASRTLLTAFHRYLFASSAASGIALQGLQVLFSLASVWLLSALLFRYVPDTHVPWRSAWRGAALTSLLFNIGNALASLYLGRASVAGAYGAAGSAVIVLLWPQISASIFLLGAEFTQHLTELDEARSDEESPSPRATRAAAGLASARPRSKGPLATARGAQR